jgi:hypothetical protein
MTLSIAQLAPTSFAFQDFNTARAAVEAANSRLSRLRRSLSCTGRCFIHAVTAGLDFE